MSRHELNPLATGKGLEVVVGWDPPLSTFYAQIWDHTRREDDPDAEVLWIGCAPSAIGDPQMVVDAVRPYAEIPEGLIGLLYGEAHA